MAGKKRRSRSSSGGSGINMDLGTIPIKLNLLPVQIDRAMFVVTEAARPQIQSWMRSNAKWTDRSTNARNGLHALAEHARMSHRIILAHSVPYGIWLEVRWSGRYAIIEPAIEEQGPKVMGTLRGILGTLR